MHFLSLGMRRIDIRADSETSPASSRISTCGRQADIASILSRTSRTVELMTETDAGYCFHSWSSAPLLSLSSLVYPCLDLTIGL